MKKVLKRKKKALILAVFSLTIALVMANVVSVFAASSAGNMFTESASSPPVETSYWTATEVVSTESTDSSYNPSLGVGPDGKVHIAWRDDTDYGGSGGDRDVFYKRFEPGVGWTTTEVVSTESTDSSYNPSLGVGPDGKVHIAWRDDTDYGGSGGDRDIFYKRFDVSAPARAILETHDGLGNVKNMFWLGDNMYIMGSCYDPSTTYDLYVVEDTNWIDRMPFPNRVSGTVSSITTDESGNIPTDGRSNAWPWPLVPGKYDIVVDVNGNGVYDEPIDALDDRDIKVTAGFFIIPELPLGTVTALLSSLAALTLYRKRSVIRIKS